ncbi:MAG: fumarylacetoacetate hydrolase family protein, partial [Ottowia sp.]|nr:fumarylacetoacetate hydrolase family protein [Ottowia sp.]
DAAALLADVNAFMTLQPGDVLLLGTDCLPDGSRPLARAGDAVELRAPGFAPLVNRLVEEGAAS